MLVNINAFITCSTLLGENNYCHMFGVYACKELALDAYLTCGFSIDEYD